MKTVGYIQKIPELSKTAFYMDGRHGGPTGGPGRFSYGYYVRNSQWRKQEKFLQFPHENRQNVVFLDGHVESLAVGEVNATTYRTTFWTGGAF